MPDQEVEPQSEISSSGWEWYKNIPVKNVYYMLYYAFRALNLKPYNFKDVAKENFEDVRDLLAAILGKGIGWQLQQGLYREYINREEDIPVMRGKLSVAGTIRNEVAQKLLLSCEYDELSENNLGNQILKTTVLLLLRNDKVRRARKKVLRREMLYFSNVDEIDPSNIQWSRLRFHQNNHLYQTLLYICQLVLEQMLLTTENGKHRLKSFIDESNMPNLYEKFILGYFQERYRGTKIKANAKEIAWDAANTADEALPDMRSDIHLSSNGNVLIIDAKWYTERDKQLSRDGNSFRVHSDNLYQIFTYVKNEDAHMASRGAPVAGMLLYARTYKKEKDGKIQDSPENKKKKNPEDPNNIGGPYYIIGNWIHVRTLDLTKNFKGGKGSGSVEDQLNSIADRFESGEFNKSLPEQKSVSFPIS